MPMGDRVFCQLSMVITVEYQDWLVMNLGQITVEIPNETVWLQLLVVPMAGWTYLSSGCKLRF